MKRLLMLVVCAALGCTQTARQPRLVDVASPPRLEERLAARVVADREGLARGIEESLAYVRSMPPEGRPWENDGTTWAALERSLVHLLRVLPRLGEEPGLLRADFEWRELQPQPLLTGYYEPELDGSLVPDPRFSVPLYGLPPALHRLDLDAFGARWKGEAVFYRADSGRMVPFYTRHEIDVDGALAPQTPVAWIRDPVDAYFLQVQGSGRLRLADGSVRHILYAGKNGREYVSLGRIMIERGLIPRAEMSMQRMRQYFAEHPAEVRDLLDLNPSYVFFRLADEGPVGAMGRTLTPMVSMATDSAFVPLGALLAVDVNLPDPAGPTERATFLGLAQDRGGAIKGARLDLFCGPGPRAEFVAGHLQERGRVFVLLKKQD